MSYAEAKYMQAATERILAEASHNCAIRRFESKAARERREKALRIEAERGMRESKEEAREIVRELVSR